MQATKWLLLFVGLAACAPGAEAGLTPAPNQPVQVYQTATPTASPPAPTEPVVLPTATPSLYTVVSGDTFFSIAARHGISLQALQLANPDVNSTFISPGMQLFIPSSDEAAQALPNPTAAAADVSPAACYTTAANELWCFLLVRNINEVIVENLGGLIQLLDAQGKAIINLVANPPLNILPPGDAMPLVAYLPEAPEGWHTARGQLSAAYPLTVDDYYLAAQPYEERIQVSTDGLSAQVTGGVKVSAPPSMVWVLAVAYDSRGDVVGIRRWESGDLSSSPDPQTVQFDVWVYSLGRPIDRVELLLEVQP
ncbi:MAG: LysM peptidoglycan-binding domain-containing protein [Anaerolineales bacterium]|nr:LysM peptidoglycan-binding domain-containing protein [Anaerolineales bacterium]MCW5855726.1 LysM peptidoglycan-binding domain-containing protein [Anaerolineales bacterium]